MNINTTPLAMEIWTDPDARKQDPEQRALAVRLSISERCAGTRKQKENYAAALEYLNGVPLPYDCRLPDLPSECLEIERCAWRAFIDDLKLREVLSIEARNKLDEQLDAHRRGYGREGALPPFNEENVWSFFEQTCQNIPNLIKEALVEVFKWLTPGQRWTGCKTSDEFKVGAKVVLTYTAHANYSGGREVEYRSRGQVDALGNALSMLDGKGVRKSTVETGEDPKTCGAYSSAWNTAWGKGEVYEDAYLTAKPFQNQKVHITFKRLDLVAQINQAGAENVLREAGRKETRGFSH